jgi:hypothetical protein
MTQDSEIYGVDSDAEACDRFAHTYIRKEWAEIEGPLYSGKWFDYRLLNPLAATYVYAHEFVKAYRVAFGRNFDSGAAEHIRPLKSRKLEELPKATISGLWRGRQTADALGIPYDVYLSQAFHWTLRYWRRAHLPRPIQLYSDLVVDRVPASWAELQEGRLYYSALPYYRMDLYQGLASQNQHHEWLLAQAAKRTNPAAALGRFVYGEKLLPEEKALGRFGMEMLERARGYA